MNENNSVLSDYDTFKSEPFAGQSNIKHTVQNVVTAKTDKRVNVKHKEQSAWWSPYISAIKEK